MAGEAIFEIGRRLKHVKENDLAHGEFGGWLESMNIDRTAATRLMKVAEEFAGTNYATSHTIGLNALYEIATLPPEQRDQPHTLANGTTKTPDEMTVRELREVKKALKAEGEARQQAEERARQAEQQAGAAPLCGSFVVKPHKTPFSAPI